MSRARLVRSLIVGSLALVASAALAAPAHAGQVLDLDGRKPGKPYKDLEMSLNVPDGRTKTIILRAKATGGSGGVYLFQDGVPTGLKVKYFTKGGKNITSALRNSGFQFSVNDSNFKRIFRMKVETTSPAADGCIPVIFDGAVTEDSFHVGVNGGLCN